MVPPKTYTVHELLLGTDWIDEHENELVADECDRCKGQGPVARMSENGRGMETPSIAVLESCADKLRS